MRRILFIFVLSVLSLSIGAKGVAIDSIYYVLHANHTAMVTYSGNKSWLSSTYSGDIVIPDTVYYAGEAYRVNSTDVATFSNGRNIRSVQLPSTLDSIRQSTFAYCSKIQELTIPASVRYLGYNMVGGCGQLHHLAVDPANPVFDSRRGCNAVMHTATNRLMAGCSATLIPEETESIHQYAFYNASFLQRLEIPAAVREIGIHNTSYCYALREIVVHPDNPYYDSREGCNAIIHTATNTLTAGCVATQIPSSVVSIGEAAFYGLSLDTVVLPASIRSIDKSAFGATTIHTLVSYATVPPTCTSSSFADPHYSTVLHVPSASLEAYRNAEGWSSFATILPIDGEDVPTGSTDPQPPIHPQSPYSIEKLFLNGQLYFRSSTGTFDVLGRPIK